MIVDKWLELTQHLVIEQSPSILPLQDAHQGAECLIVPGLQEGLAWEVDEWDDGEDAREQRILSALGDKQCPFDCLIHFPQPHLDGDEGGRQGQRHGHPLPSTEDVSNIHPLLKEIRDDLLHAVKNLLVPWMARNLSPTTRAAD